MKIYFSLLILLLSTPIIIQAQKLSEPDSLHQLALKYLADGDVVYSTYNFTKEAEYYYFQRNPEKSRQVIDYAIKTFPEGKDSLFSTYSHMLKFRAITYAVQENSPKTALGFERQLRHLYAYKCDSNDLAMAYRNAAQSQFNIRNPKGIMYINKAVTINKALANYTNIIDIYVALSNYLSGQELNELSDRYLSYCIFLFETYDLKDKKLLAELYKHKCINLEYQKKYEESLEWIEKAYQIYIDEKLDDDNIVAIAGNVALEALSTKDYTKAKSYSHKAIQHADKYFPSESARHGHIYLALGEIYMRSDQLDSADYYLDKAIAIYKEKIGENYGFLTIPYHHKAKVCEKSSKFEEAAMFYQKSIYTNFGKIEELDTTFKNIPQLHNTYFSFDALKHAMLEKSKMLHKVDLQNENKFHLAITASHLRSLDSLEWSFTNRKTMNMEDNIRQFKEYEEVLDLMASIASESQKQEYTLQGFQMLNNQKASYLSSRIKRKQNIENDTLQTIFQKQQEEILVLEESYNSRSKLSIKEQDSLLAALSEAYLSQLDLQNEINNQAIQDGKQIEMKSIDIDYAVRMAKENSCAVLDYFYYDDNLYCYLINEKGLKLKSIAIPDDFEALSKSFLKAVKTQDPSQIKIGKALSKYILMPLEEELASNQKIVIIPFGILSEIPFDLLPVDKNGTLAIEKHAISYHYSTKLWMQSMEVKKPEKPSLLTLAPVFSKKSDIEISNYTEFANDTTLNNKIVYRGGKLKPLPHSLKEVKSIAKLWSEKNYNVTTLTNSAANIEGFLYHLPQSDIIHIATHGISSRRNPYRTGLFFYNPEGEQQEDQFLSVHDLSNLNIEAHLIVLSACKTGSGQLAHGEGVIALPRAFINSGAPNVLASLWKIHDEKTKYLMTRFYTYVSEGRDYSSSLQLAKLDCKNKGMLALDWAGFILIGQ